VLLTLVGRSIRPLGNRLRHGCDRVAAVVGSKFLKKILTCGFVRVSGVFALVAVCLVGG